MNHFLHKIVYANLAEMFIPTDSLFSMVIRGSIMFIVMYTLLRLFRRPAGSIGLGDMLVIVVIADAGQNGMVGSATSVTEAIVVILTIFMWDWLFDWLGFKSKFFKKLLEGKEILIIDRGKIIESNMRKEMVSRSELYTHLRLHGIENIKKVKKCFIETNGNFSIVRYAPSEE